ncbi:MAG TPA: HEAT repeat domain-containing protein [Thermoanaerobaculia bacterium]|nr:HEAT repeat domain-containing protein [Thermoanaerobaculia bacterium]
MDCRDVLRFREAAILRLAGELPTAEGAWLDDHLAGCPVCRDEERRLALAWERLGEDRVEPPSPSFLARTEALLTDEVRRRTAPPFAPVVPIRPSARLGLRPLLQAAALVAAAAGGFLFARTAPRIGAPAASVAATFPVVAQRSVDVSEAAPDLSNRPRLANVAFRPADPEGRIGVAFDVTTRYTVTGRPDQKGIADLLVYLMSGAADTEGTRGRVIDLVSQSTKGSPGPSPDIVAALAETVKHDRNPGVRKKAVEALAQLPPSEATRDALILALKSDENPAVRILAVDGLARGATVMKDAATLDALRSRASDERENGYVRVQAAQALSKLEL